MDNRKGIMIRVSVEDWKTIKREALERGLTLQDFALEAMMSFVSVTAEEIPAEPPVPMTMPAAPARPDILTYEEVAQELRISSRHLKNLISQGKGPPTVCLGARVLFHRCTLEKWLRSVESRHARTSRGRPSKANASARARAA